MHDHFQGLLREFNESCECLDEETTETVRERRSATISALRVKLEAYRDLCQDFAKDISQGIDDAEQEMNNKLFGEILGEQEPVGGEDTKENATEVPEEALAAHPDTHSEAGEDFDINNLFSSIL